MIPDFLDPFYKQHVVDKLSQWVDEYPEDSAETLESQALTINRLLLEPLNAWLKDQKKENTATEACVNLIFAIQEIISGFQYYGVRAGDIETLSNAWSEFQIQMGWGSTLDVVENKPLIELGQKFKSGSKLPRTDALGLEMEKTTDSFIQKYGKKPTAKELWAFMKAGKAIQEIDEDDIFWKNPSGKEFKTSFKSFQNRLTKLTSKKNKKK